MNASPTVQILVDDREQASGLPMALRRRLGTDCVKVIRLTIGDVQVGGRYAIERKTAADFVASLLDGRLANQVQALADSGCIAVLLLEGEFSRESLAGMAASEVRAALLSLQLDRRLVLIRSRDLEDSALWIEALARREMDASRPFAPTLRPAAAPRPHPVLHRKMLHPPSQPVDNFLTAPTHYSTRNFLLKIQGFGPKRAKALLAQYPTLPQMLEAGEEKLAAITAVGPTRARKVIEAIRRVM